MVLETASPRDSQVARIRRYQEILTDFGRMAPEVSGSDHLFQLACVQAARGIGIGHAKIMRYWPEAGDLLIVAGAGWHPGVVGHTQLGTDMASLPGRALQTRDPVIVSDLPHDPEFRYAAVLRDHHIVSAANVPIAVGSVVWGVLEVDSETPRHFGSDDVQFLSAMGNIVGLALASRLELQRMTAVAADATQALDWQGVLLSELQHRNKNDFQLILSMLLLQKRKQQDEQARRGFDHVMDRVTAISMAYDQLSPTRGISRIELSDYLRALCGNLAQRQEEVEIETGLAACEMPHERAVPLGLIVNELVTNALKHAFPDGRAGKVQVVFEMAGEGEGCLRVRDDGVGLGPPRAGGSGTGLVQRLAQQIGGEVAQEVREQGVGISVRFPLVV